MSRDTLALAKAELVGLLADGTTPRVAGVDVVYDHLPPRTMVNGPTSVAVYTAGMDARYWQLSVVIFKAAAGDHKAAQDALDLLMPAVDEATSSAPYGPSEWRIDPPTDDEVWSATATYQVGRQDFP